MTRARSEAPSAPTTTIASPPRSAGPGRAARGRANRHSSLRGPPSTDKLYRPPLDGRPPNHGDRPLLQCALDHLGLLPVLLPPPLRVAPHVHHDAADGADVPRPHLPGAGLFVSLAAGLRDPPPRAPRLQRHGAGPARPGLLRQRAQHDVDDRHALQRAPDGDVVTRAPLPRQLPRVAVARPRRLDLAGARRLGHGLRARLPLARNGVVAVPAPPRPVGARTGARRDRQLVRPPLRLPQLQDQRRLAALPAPPP